LKKFNTQIVNLNSNGSKMYQKYLNDPDQWEQMKSITMLAFLCVHGHSQFDVSLENFKLILNIHFAIECNSFGVSKSD
jgi:hypothetical protein